MKDTAKVQGHTNLVRDLKSQAIINTDSDAYARYMARKAKQQGKDDEARVFYVGATRAKKELHLVHRTEGQYEYEPIFFHERNCA